MKKILLILTLVLNLTAVAQTTAVSATLTDSDSTVWTGAKVYVSFSPNPNVPNLSVYTIAGVSITSPTYSSLLQQTVTTNNSGAFSVTLLDNNLVQPSGSGWYFVIQSNTSANAVTFTPISVTGSSTNLTSFFTSHIIAPRFPAINSAFGYADLEVTPIPNAGGQYFNSAPAGLVQRVWNGNSWQNAGGGTTIPYPSGSGIVQVVTGNAWGATLTPPSSALVGISDTQALTNKTLNGVKMYFGTDTGSATAYVVSTGLGLSTLLTGTQIWFLPANNNSTANPTLAVDSTGAKTIMQLGNNALNGVVLQTTMYASAIYNGTNWVILNSAQPNSYYGKGVLFPTAPATACIMNALNTTTYQCTGTFPTSGLLVGTTDTQTLTNKSIAATEVNSGILAVAQGGTGTAGTAAGCLALAPSIAVPCIGGQGTATGLNGTGTTGTINFYTTNAQANAVFNLCVFIAVDTAGTAGVVTPTFTWTTPGGLAENGAFLGTVSLTAAFNQIGSCVVIQTKVTTSFNMSIAASGATGTPSWEYAYTLTRTN